MQFIICQARRLLLLILLPIALVSLGFGNSVEFVLKEYYKAMGGRAALEQISSVNLRGTLSYADGSQQLVSILKKRPNKVRLSFSTNDIRVAHAYNGTLAWTSLSSPQGSISRRMDKDFSISFIRSAPLENALFKEFDENVRHELGEDVEFGNLSFYQIYCHFSDGSYSVHWIEKESFRERRIKEYDAKGKLLSEIIPSNFVRFAGVDFAMRIIRFENGKKVSTMDFQSVEVNPGCLDAVFDPPTSIKD